LSDKWVDAILKRVIIVIQFLIIIALVFVIIMKNGSDHLSHNDSIITNIDQAGFNRIEEVVNRFHNGKGDNLMIISPTIDSGPWIYDIYSNGREMIWVVDNTRDGMSGERGKTEYICKAIQMNETEEYFVVELSKCNNFHEEEKLPIFTIIKDQL